MAHVRTITIALFCLVIASGLVACGKTGQNANANVNSVAAAAKPSPGLILSATPSKGPAAGGTTIKIMGEGFTGSPTVLFGMTEGKDVKVVSATELSVITPAGTKGDAVDITLRAPDAPTSTLVDGFHYE